MYDEWVWFDNYYPPTFDPISNEYVYGFDLFNILPYSSSGESFQVVLERTDWLNYTSSFLALTNSGCLVGNYAADGGYVEAPYPFVAFDNLFEASRRASTGIYKYQTPVSGAVEAYTHHPENDWDGIAYQPVDVNRGGTLLGYAREFEEGVEVGSTVYKESSGAAYTTLIPPSGENFVPLKLNGLGHAVLKIENSSPAEFGIYKGSEWIPLTATFPSGINFTPVALDDADRVVGNTSGSTFGPTLLTEQGIVSLAKAAPGGGGWNLLQGSVKAVNDHGVMVGVASFPGQTSSTNKRCFILWRNDDQDGDGIPDDWERQIFEEDANDALVTISDVRDDDDADGDGLSNLEEFWNNSDPVTNAETLASEVGLTVFNRLE